MDVKRNVNIYAVPHLYYLETYTNNYNFLTRSATSQSSSMRDQEQNSKTGLTQEDHWEDFMNEGIRL